MTSFKTEIKFNMDIQFEILTIENGVITKIKLNDNEYIINETPISIPKKKEFKQGNRTGTVSLNTKLCKWIKAQNKEIFDIMDYINSKDYTNIMPKKQIEMQLHNLCRINFLEQISDTKFKVVNFKKKEQELSIVVNWINKNNKKVFLINDFYKENPGAKEQEVNKELKELVSHNFITQTGKFEFKVNKPKVESNGKM